MTRTPADLSPLTEAERAAHHDHIARSGRTPVGDALLIGLGGRRCCPIGEMADDLAREMEALRTAALERMYEHSTEELAAHLRWHR